MGVSLCARSGRVPTLTLSTSSKKGWLRHCSAVALSLGSNDSMGTSQSAKLCATSVSHSYFSVRTS